MIFFLKLKIIVFPNNIVIIITMYLLWEKKQLGSCYLKIVAF